MRQQDGTTLLETLFVFIVIAAILFFGINRFLNYKKQAQIAVIKQNINIIADAINEYYFLNCKASDSSFSVSMAQLRQQNLLSGLAESSLLVKSGDEQYSISTQKIGNTVLTQKPIYHFNIQATLINSIKDAEYYQSELGANSITQNTLNWLHVPSYPRTNYNRVQSVNNANLQFFKETAVGGNPQDQPCAY